MQTTITRKKDGNFYKKCLKHIQGQFKNAVEITEMYVNSENKIYAGEWVDNAGIINFNSGFAPDVFKTIKFI